MKDLWPWLTLAGLGAFHGINPAMGWLFAVALGLHRGSRAIVFVALAPIALGHAMSIALTAGLLVAAGVLVPMRLVQIASGVLLIAWGLYHWRYGHRGRVRIGLQAGLFGLAFWSFLMASAHGAGLMLWPALMPLCLSPQAVAGGPGGVLGPALLGLGIHTLALLAVTGVIAGSVYEWVGLAILRRAWVNIDLLWTAALLATGVVLLAI